MEGASTNPTPDSHLVPALCLGAVVLGVVLAAIEPRYVYLYVSENALVFVSVPWLALTYRRFRFSNASYLALAVFFLMHEVGAHYGYNEAPVFGEWASWGWSRNPYDRVVHAAFGLLGAVPIRELLVRKAGLRGFVASQVTLAEIGAASLVYELLEWAYAKAANPDAVPMFLGAQGDPWDAQKDMANAFVGGLVSCVLLWARGRPRTSAS
ncbi:MAG: DUF2238 domain-containing protein [Polyangiales bacterium]